VRSLQQLVARGELDHSVLQLAIDRYQLHNVNAGTSGTAGGEA
jgi:pyruvate dehydrogenase E1 component